MTKSSDNNSNVICRGCHKKNSMHLLHDFKELPVAGYLETDRDSALKAPRFKNAIAICMSCGLVQQAYDDAREFLVNRVYQNYQPTYSMSNNVRLYLEAFLDKALIHAEMAQDKRIVEIGCNDGGFLKILKRHGYYPIGFDPSADSKMLPDCIKIIKEFFGTESARRFVSECEPVRMVISRHTLEHVFEPDIFLNGLNIILDKDGIAVIEVPYLNTQMMNNQFQSMSYQHITFFTVSSMRNVLINSGLDLFDVEFSHMDAGSMIIYVKKPDNIKTSSTRLDQVLDFEKVFELDNPNGFNSFFQKYEREKINIKKHFDNRVKAGSRIFAFGAGGKGQAMLNMLNINDDIIPYVIDDTPGYEGLFIPGTGNCVINSKEQEIKNASTIFITAPSHINEIMTKEMRQIRPRVKYFVSVPAFHYVN